MQYVSIAAMVAMLVTIASASIITIDTTIPNSYHAYTVEAQYSKGDALSLPPGNGDSFVELDIQTKLEISGGGPVAPAGDYHLDVLVYHFESTKYLAGGGLTCCTEAYVNAGVCSPVDSVVLALPAGVNAEDVDLFKIYVNMSEKRVVKLNQRFTITKTGSYLLELVSCPPTSSAQKPYAVRVTGEARFMNPYGYLPAEEWPLLWFYILMGIAFLVATIVLVVYTVRYRKDIHPAQIGLNIVMAICLLEHFLLALFYTIYNNVGVPPFWLYALSVLLSTSRIVISGVMMLFLARGYLVINREPGSLPFLMAVAVGAFCFGGAHVMFSMLIALDRYDRFLTLGVPNWLTGLLSTCLSLMVVGYFAVVGIMLVRTAKRQLLEHHAPKKRLYINLLRLIMIGSALTVVANLMQIVLALLIDNYEFESWRYDWMWEAYYQLLFLAVLVFMVVVWRPSAQNSQYAYAPLGDAPGDIHLPERGGSIGSSDDTHNSSSSLSAASGTFVLTTDDDDIESASSHSHPQAQTRQPHNNTDECPPPR